MTDAEKDALEWLDSYIASFGAYGPGHPITIRRMVAEPRLPKEPDSKMRMIYAGGGVVEPDDTHRRLYAHLTKPATKTVEVWHVEWADGDIPHIDDPYLSREFAERGASLRRDEGRGRCIHVTGPHKQEVPA